MNELTGFQRDVLIVLNGRGPVSGTDLQDELEEYYDADVFGGRLYPVLNELVEQGYVAKGQRDGRTNEYRLTERGSQTLVSRKDWVDRHVAHLD